jgi:hypothetical protein
VHDLRVFIAPTRLGHPPLRFGHRRERCGEHVEHDPVGAVADGVRLDLDSCAQCAFQHVLEGDGVGGDQSAGLRIVTVRLKQRRTA